MRVTTSLWVAAYLRRVERGGGFAAIERRGADAAGAIFIVVSARDGRSRLIGPAPQAAYGEDAERRFMAIVARENGSEEALRQRIAREAAFDPDIWVIGVEDRAGRDFLEEALIDPAARGPDWPPS